MAEFTRVLLKEHQAMKTKIEELESAIKEIEAKLQRISIGGVVEDNPHVGGTEL